jgi:hypothetical protein
VDDAEADMDAAHSWRGVSKRRIGTNGAGAGRDVLGRLRGFLA